MFTISCLRFIKIIPILCGLQYPYNYDNGDVMILVMSFPRTVLEVD